MCTIQVTLSHMNRRNKFFFMYIFKANPHNKGYLFITVAFIGLFIMPECKFKEELVNLLFCIAVEVRILW